MTVRSRFRSSVRVLIVPLLLGTPLPAAGQESAQPVTLDEAIQLALDRSPGFAQSQAALESAGTGRRSAWGSFLPSVSLSSGASLNSTTRFDPNTQVTLQGSSDSYNAGVSASYSLFEGGRRFDELERSGAEYTAAEARREDQRFQVVLQTESMFLEALRQEELVAVQETRVRRAEESLEMIRRRVQLGEATRSDSLRARLELANAQQAELQARTLLRAAGFALGRQIGRAAPATPAPLDDPDPGPLSLTDAQIYEIAESQSPTVAAAQADLRATEAGVQFARAAWLPTVSLSSGYSWNNDALALGDGNTSWNLRLSASYPIFNGFNREAQIDRAQQQARVSRLQDDDARLAAREEADAALQRLRTAAEAARISQEAVQVAEEDLRVVNERYRVGVATILDLITSQVALEQAEADRVSARYDHLLARAQLEAVLGREL